jgi:hypothetical protein
LRTLPLDDVCFRWHEDFAFSGMIGGTDDAFLLHAFNQRGGAVVTDAETPLHVGGGGFAIAKHDGHGLIVGILGIGEITGAGRAAAIAFLVVFLGNRFQIFRRPLCLQIGEDFFELNVVKEGAV